jgi:hypothetical protein
MVDVRKADEWVEIVKDVQEGSMGMAEISLNDDQTVVTIAPITSKPISVLTNSTFIFLHVSCMSIIFCR